MTVAALEPNDDAEPSLADLAERINLLAAGGGRSSMTLERAIDLGDALLAAKGWVEAEGWGRWRAANCAVSAASACRYMRLAAHRDALPGAPGDLTLRLAVERLRGLPALKGGRGPEPRYSEEVRVEVLRACGEGGKSVRAVAADFGIPKSTVDRWLHPERAEREVVRLRRARARRRAVNEEAERREGIAWAAKRSGGPSARAVSELRRSAQALQQALDEAPDHVTKAAFGAALGFLYKAEDEIGRAVRGAA